MDYAQIVELIKDAVPYGPYRWMDLGSGDGAFTLALSSLAGPHAEIYSVERDRKRMERQKRLFVHPEPNIHFLEQDFTKPLPVSSIDGIVMANSLHYVKDKIAFLEDAKKYFAQNGRMVIVEYDTDEGNAWVPYPISFKSLKHLLKNTGFREPELLKKEPSRYWGGMYSALIYFKTRTNADYVDNQKGS